MANKENDLNEALDKINKRYGDGSIMRGGDGSVKNIEFISTGSMALDLAIGGGIPRGRSTEIFGWESSGKTTIAQHFVANAQKLGDVAYLDNEHAVDRDYAQVCGVDFEKLLFAQPSNGEEAMEIAETLIRSGKIVALVIDSIANLVPAAEVEGDMGSAPMGSQARLMSQAMRKLTPLIKQNNVAVLWTNQQRHKIAVMYGSPEYQPGGFAMKFGASVRVRLSRVNAETDESHAHIKATVVKNKVSAPFRVAEFNIDYAKGIDSVSDLAEVAISREILERKGAYYRLGELQWQGKQAVVEALRSDKQLFGQVEGLVRAK